MHPLDISTFCGMLAFTGCRISEALALTADSIDLESKHVVFKCLKKRGKRVFRAVPLPADYLRLLTRWLATRERGAALLWTWSRMTAYRRICEVMEAAGIQGSYATPKGLRHAFGVRAIQASVPLTLVQRWLGHADIKTTAIYTCVIGAEERQIASRMWRERATWNRPKTVGEWDSAHEGEAEMAPRDELPDNTLASPVSSAKHRCKLQTKTNVAETKIVENLF